jgi:hypothetical protein
MYPLSQPTRQTDPGLVDLAEHKPEGGPEIDISAILFVTFALVIVGGLAVWIAIVVRRAGELNRESDSRLASLEASAVKLPTLPVTFEDPLAAPVAAAAGSLTLTPPASSVPEAVTEPAPEPLTADPVNELEAKLRRLDGLHARGVITDAELAAARASLLAE